MRAYEFDENFKIEEAYATWDSEEIEAVKSAYDQGKTTAEIASMLKMSSGAVRDILAKHYPERQRRSKTYNITPDAKEYIVTSFLDGKGMTPIADELGIAHSVVKTVLSDAIGIERINQELNKRRTMAGTRFKNKATPELVQYIRDEYANGKSLSQIARDIDYKVNRQTVKNILSSQADWLELQAKWELRQKPIRRAAQVTKKFTRAGEIDNLHSKSTNTKHTSGVKWK